jgi:hypothetical protein
MFPDINALATGFYRSQMEKAPSASGTFSGQNLLVQMLHKVGRKNPG